jgi:hypothetical protein
MIGRAAHADNDPPGRNVPWHEKVPLVGPLRARLRERVLLWLAKLLDTDQGKRIFVSSLKGIFLSPQCTLPDELVTATQPFPELGTAQRQKRSSDREDIVIITARFRSGSTLLWNLFRHVEGCTAYYEPFNERRWFDPSTRGTHIDPTHRKAEEYWREYEGLDLLGDYYRQSWIDHDLFMNAESWDPGMKHYVELLVEHAPGRPILQFNRVDFRLGWFRQQFPHAKIVHLYRHPRNQWCSALVDLQAFPTHKTMADFVFYDRYYLHAWAADLKYHFPFLAGDENPHPYQVFYYLWKLSYLFGRYYADHSFAFEELVNDPKPCMEKLFSELAIRNANIDRLTDLIVMPAPQRWRDYADDAWFAHQETICENTLAEFFAKRYR